MSDNELLSAKIGDKIIVSRSGIKELKEITRISPSRFFVRVTERYEMAFHKKDGLLVGESSWARTRARLASTEEIEKIGAEQEAREFKEWLVKEMLTLKEIRAIKSLVLSMRTEAQSCPAK